MEWTLEALEYATRLLTTSPKNNLSRIIENVAHFVGTSRIGIILREEWYEAACIKEKQSNKEKQPEGKKVNGKKESSLIVAAGYPENEHGIGLEISKQYGKDFLEEIIKKGNIVHIKDSKKDERVAYMRSSIEYYQTEQQLFVVLYFKKGAQEYGIPPFGVVVFDLTANDIRLIDLKKLIPQAKKAAKAIVEVILTNRLLTKEKKLEKQKACANHWAENAEGFQDGIRNSVMKLELNAKKMINAISQDKIRPVSKYVSLKELFGETSRKKLNDAEKMKEARERIEMFKIDLALFSQKAEDALLAVGFDPSKLNVQGHNLWKFLNNVADEFAAKNKEIQISINFPKLNKNSRASFDSEKMKQCLGMLLKNALIFSAKEITISAVSRSVADGKNNIRITVSRDGTQMGPTMIRNVFMLFADGGGLSFVKTVIEAHGGSVSAKENKGQTNFIIQLPLD